VINRGEKALPTLATAWPRRPEFKEKKFRVRLEKEASGSVFVIKERSQSFASLGGKKSAREGRERQQEGKKHDF